MDSANLLAPKILEVIPLRNHIPKNLIFNKKNLYNHHLNSNN